MGVGNRKRKYTYIGKSKESLLFFGSFNSFMYYSNEYMNKMLKIKHKKLKKMYKKVVYLLDIQTLE